MIATTGASINQFKTNFLDPLISSLSTQKWRTSLNLDFLKQTHSIIITNGLSHNNPFLLHNLLLHSLPSISLSAAADLTYIFTLFRRTDSPTTSLCNSMIKAFSTSSAPRMSISCFAIMRKEGVPPNKHTFPLLLKALSRFQIGKNENPFQIYGQIVKFGLGFDGFVGNSLVSAFANCGYVGVARKMFDGMLVKDLIAWTAMIDGYVKNSCAVEAMECFLEMKSMGVRVDEVTVVSVLRVAGMMRIVWFGRWVHGFYVESGRVRWDVHVGSALIDMYSKCGFYNDARQVFDEMSHRNLVCWSALSAGYVQCNRFRDALLVFQEMLCEKVEPNELTLTSVLTACAQLGALDRGKWVHRYINRNGLKVNSMLGTALINMYAKCGCISDSFLVFKKIPIKDVYPWTAMINGFAMHGDAVNALSLFYQMSNYGIRPNEVTFLAVLSACSHGGLVDEGRELFGSMTCVYNLKPKVDHYGCMVDLLGRAGHLEEAMKLTYDMPMEPTPGVWGALFSACMIHKGYGLGAQIGEHLIELQPHHSGRYALLANLYSMCQNWEAVARVRKLMKQKGVEKIPGWSWIELNGLIQEFISFDKSHNESKVVYSILDSISIQLEVEGCVRDTTNLRMFDVD
ncbi:hypothetical protein ACSBR2_039228 [Camellia fascicularis]